MTTHAHRFQDKKVAEEILVPIEISFIRTDKVVAPLLDEI
jgi:hypothetical protein